MTTRTTLRPQTVISAQSMTSTITSLPTILGSMTGIGYSITWTGSAPVGSLSVQVSNDYSLNANGTVHNPGTWSTVTVSLNGAPVNSIPVTGNTGNGFIDVIPTSAYAVQLVYTPTSGTGTMNAVVCGKVA